LNTSPDASTALEPSLGDSVDSLSAAVDESPQVSRPHVSHDNRQVDRTAETLPLL